MLRIRSIKFDAFRSFRDAQETPQLPPSGLVLVKGKNLDTNGSSGAGKSNLVLGLAYAFGYSPVPATALQSWLTNTKMQVVVELDSDQGPVTLSRGRETYLTIGETTTKGSVKAVDERLRQLVGLPTDLLQALCYRPQKSRGLFLSLTDAEKKEFLSQLLGLGDLETAVEVAKKHISELSAQITATNARVELLAKQHAGYSGLDANLAAATKVKLDELDANIAIEKAKLKDFKPKTLPAWDDSKLLEAQNQLAETERAFVVANEVLQKAKAERDIIIAQISAIPNIQRELDRLQGEAKTLRASICPTCAQPWTQAQSRLMLVESTLEQLHDKIYEIECLKRDKLPPLQEAVQLVEQAYRTASDNVNTQKEVVIRCRQAKAVWESANRAEIAKQEQEAWKDLSALQQFRSELYMMYTELDTGLKQRDDLAVQLATENTKLFKLQADELLEEDFLQLMGRDGFMSAIFDEVLVEIGNEANRYMAGLPNVDTTIIEFHSESETKAGTSKRKIVPVLMRNGQNIPWGVGLSGGQETSVELAVDLAVAQVIARRTGKMPGWLVLDEAFEGHDLPVKEACVEILRRAAQDRLIIVIDHATEVKELFDLTIDIESDNYVSIIRA